MKKLIPVAVSLLVLCGCMGNLLIPTHTSEISYKEEVRLHDGRIIVVERQAERKGRAVPGSPPMQSWEEIRTANPDTGEEIIWQEDAASSPRVLDFVSGTPYFVAAVGAHSSCQKYRYPKLNFVFFKYDHGWQRISYEELPEVLDTNLFVGMWNAEVIGQLERFMAVEKKIAYYEKHTYGVLRSVREHIQKKRHSYCSDFSSMRDYPKDR